MKLHFSSFALQASFALALAVSALQGQTLYLLKGGIRPSDSEKPWRSEILRVDEKAGALSVVRDLGTDNFDGIAFCFVNYEHRVVVLGMPSQKPNTFLVLDMDDVRNPSVLRPDFSRLAAVNWEPWPPPPDPRIKPPPLKEIWAGGGALLFSNNLGLVLSLDLYGPNGTADYALPLRRGVLQGRGLSRLERAAFISSGAIGIGYHSQGSAEPVSPYQSNLKLRRRAEIDMGVRSPTLSDAVRAGGKPFSLQINDSRSMTLHSAQGPDSSKAGDGSSTIYVHNKKSARWTTLAVPGEAPSIRSVGKYLLGLARNEDQKRERESAGKAEFEELTKNVRWQDGVAASSAHYEAYYPGILFAIDVETGKMFQWRTNQADSEILWADDSAFYYRRANELLKVEIVTGASGPVIGPVSSILKADVLLDVHAAFRGK